VELRLFVRGFCFHGACLLFFLFVYESTRLSFAFWAAGPGFWFGLPRHVRHPINITCKMQVIARAFFKPHWGLHNTAPMETSPPAARRR